MLLWRCCSFVFCVCVSAEKAAVIFIFSLAIHNFFFKLFLLLRFSLGFKSFNYNVTCCSFFHVFCALGLIEFLGLLDLYFSLNLEWFGHFSSTSFYVPFLLSFRNSNYVHIYRLYEFFTHYSRIFLFIFPSLFSFVSFWIIFIALSSVH